MGLFERKLDYDKNSLFIKFDLETKKYRMQKWNKFIPEKKLNRKTRKYLEEYNKKLEDENILNEEIRVATNDKKQQEQSEKRRKKLREIGYEPSSFVVLGFKPGTMAKEVKDYLIPLLTEEDVLIGIHRAGSTSMEDIENIFEKGFLMTGHGLNFIQPNGTPLYENFGYYDNNMEILDQLVYANGYKNSKGSIIIRIPDDELKDETMYDDKVITNQITDEKTGKLKEVKQIIRTLKKEYIIGYVPVDENFHVEKIILNPNATYNKERNIVTTNNIIEKTKELLANELMEKELNNENTENIEIKQR